MNILAIDLSLSATGVVYPEGRVETRQWAPVPKHKGAMTAAMAGDLHRDRLNAAEAWFRANMAMNRPTMIAIEGYSYGSKGSSITQLAEVRGLLRFLADSYGVPFVEIDPTTIKMFGTGKGNAGKPEMIANARERFGYDAFDDNAADALILWHLVHQYLDTGQSTVKLPQSHMRALDGKIHAIDWQGIAG